MIRFILKIWPALLPITIYIIWILYRKKSRKKDFIEGEYKIMNEKSSAQQNQAIGAFSLRNNHFLMVIFFTLILIIFGLIIIVVKQNPIKNPVDAKNISKIIIE